MKPLKQFINEASDPTTFLPWGQKGHKIQTGVWYKTESEKLQFKINSYKLVRNKNDLVDISVSLVVRVFKEGSRDSDFRKYNDVDFDGLNKVLNRLLKE